ncbi:MAG: ATP-binding cassette domain-containing protein [Deltaproteobacteria bacterium]|nr:ATP-binding cassette domain-containing protein [Deltaproteobacteria bacterium]MBN2670113.1 ATP-binding cassette domain-containing protein [Deltaproteobacteria bacterium]
MTESAPILRLTDGVRFASGRNLYSVAPLRCFAGQWVAFVPSGEDPVTDPSGALARTLVTLSPPERGTVELFELDGYHIAYRDVQRLRSRLGFVQGFGGLLSNRTIRENVALPAAVHGKIQLAEEQQLVSDAMKVFKLETVQDLHPHLVDGYTRWRACLARALILTPKLVVLEGIGDWEMDKGQGIAWKRLLGYHQRGDNLICVCASRRNEGFQSWFVENGGTLVEYTDKTGTPSFIPKFEGA